MEDVIYHLHFTGRSIKRTGKKFFECPVELIRYLEPILEQSYQELCTRIPAYKAKERLENSYLIREINPELCPNYYKLFGETRIAKRKIEYNEPQDEMEKKEVA